MVACLLASVHALRLPASVKGGRLPAPRMHHVEPNEHHMQPSQDLSVTDVINVLCRGLQENDDPKPDAGIERLYHFCTPPGRVAIAPPPPRSGLQGGVTLEYWMENAASPALGALTYCTSFRLVDEPVITPGTNTRGRFCTQLVEVGNSPLEDESDKVAALQKLVEGAYRRTFPFRLHIRQAPPTSSDRIHPPRPAVRTRTRKAPFGAVRTARLSRSLTRRAVPSVALVLLTLSLCAFGSTAADDAFLQDVLDAVRSGGELPSPPPSAELKTAFWFKMEEQRRPPQQGCWLLQEILPVKKTLFQQLNEGGEEFEGDDSG